jgi:hypothetical protein
VRELRRGLSEASRRKRCSRRRAPTAGRRTGAIVGREISISRHFLAGEEGTGSVAAPRHYDAVLCWYHDQGLIPFKMMSRDAGCQITFGLPFVRTSPDHGSALDLAQRGGAKPGSMRYALRLAAKLTRGISI